MKTAPRLGQLGAFYIPQLDGLRFFAFLIVFLSHGAIAGASRHEAWYARLGHSVLLAGGFGVDLFFVLSSYLITSLLVREADVRGRIDVPAFWLRRVLRIWPLYFAAVATCAVLGEVPARYVPAFATFLANWAFVAWGAPGSVIEPLWSVSVEEQFYLTWPLVLLALPRRFLRPACCGLIATAFFTRYVLFAAGVPVSRVWPNSLSHLDPIGLGALIALSPRLSLRRPWIVGISSALGLVGAAGWIWYGLVQPDLRVSQPLLTTLAFLGVALSCAGLVLAALAAGGWLGHPVLVYLGRISYGMYVVHAAAIELASAWWWPARLPGGLVITVLVATASYRWLELPFLRLKSRFTYIRSGAPPQTE